MKLSVVCELTEKSILHNFLRINFVAVIVVVAVSPATRHSKFDAKRKAIEPFIDV